MRDRQFDAFVHSFGAAGNRRQVIAGAMGGLLALRRVTTKAAQPGPASCAAEGDVCTLLYGCCEGLTCATSAINPSYGVCVPGSGGMVTTGTALVLPFDEGDGTTTQTQTTTTTTTSTTSTTDPQAERQAKLQEKRTRRKSRQNEQQDRRQTHKSEEETRRNTQDQNNGPNLQFTLFNPGTSTEILKVSNVDSTTVYLNQIESRLAQDGQGQISPAVSVVVGDSFFFLSHRSDPTGGSWGWTDGPICTGSRNGEGFVITASRYSGGANTEYEFLCSGPRQVTMGTLHHRSNDKARKHRKSRGKGK